MTKTPNKKRKSESIAAGITPLQMEEALAKYAANDARINSINAEMDEDIQAIRDEYDSDLNILNSENGLLMATIKGYCVQNRESLFVEKKSIETVFGKLGFRKSPHALKALKGFKWDAITEKLKELLPDYIRTVDEPNKEKLLADRDKEGVADKLSLVGVQVAQDETFYIELKTEAI
jgi:phage host-nuclease inhibitor protein Gam